MVPLGHLCSCWFAGVRGTGAETPEGHVEGAGSDPGTGQRGKLYGMV